MAFAPPAHTGVLASLWPDGRFSCTGCTGTTCPDSPCTGACVGSTGGRCRAHRPHTCVLPLYPPAVMSESGCCAAAAHAARCHADSRCGRAAHAARAGSAAAAVGMWRPAVALYHTRHSPAHSQPPWGWCGRLEVEQRCAAARPPTCGLGCRDSVWQLVWPNCRERGGRDRHINKSSAKLLRVC